MIDYFLVSPFCFFYILLSLIPPANRVLMLNLGGANYSDKTFDSRLYRIGFDIE